MSNYDPRLVGEYIRQAAAKRGIDPDVALRVARSEGLGEYIGDGGSSFGPFQLHYGGVAKGGNAVGGLGDVFTRRTGLDARNPDTWQAQVDFSLDEAKRGGWGPWHGWKGPAMAGISGKYTGTTKSEDAPTSASSMTDAGLLSSPAIDVSPAKKDQIDIADLLQATTSAPKSWIDQTTLSDLGGSGLLSTTPMQLSMIGPTPKVHRPSRTRPAGLLG